VGNSLKDALKAAMKKTGDLLSSFQTSKKKNKADIHSSQKADYTSSAKPPAAGNSSENEGLSFSQAMQVEGVKSIGGGHRITTPPHNRSLDSVDGQQKRKKPVYIVRGG